MWIEEETQGHGSEPEILNTPRCISTSKPDPIGQQWSDRRMVTNLLNGDSVMATCVVGDLQSQWIKVEGEEEVGILVCVCVCLWVRDRAWKVIPVVFMITILTTFHLYALWMKQVHGGGEFVTVPWALWFNRAKYVILYELKTECMHALFAIIDSLMNHNTMGLQMSHSSGWLVLTLMQFCHSFSCHLLQTVACFCKSTTRGAHKHDVSLCFLIVPE